MLFFQFKIWKPIIFWLFLKQVCLVLIISLHHYKKWNKNSLINTRGDISRAGIILLWGLQLRALLECGFYSREGLIWGNTVSNSKHGRKEVKQEYAVINAGLSSNCRKNFPQNIILPAPFYILFVVVSVISSVSSRKYI